MKILTIILVAFIITYFFMDRQLQLYGRSYFEVYHKLPMKIRPQFWGYDQGNLGFVLLDDHDMTLIARGNKYFSSDVVVSEIVRYGFDNEMLVAQIKDSTGSDFFVECTQNPKSKENISVKVEMSLGINNPQIEWIEIKDNADQMIKVMILRNYLLVAIFVVILIMALKSMNVLRRWSSSL